MYSLRLRTTFGTFATVYRNGEAMEALSDLYVDEIDIREIRELLVLANKTSQQTNQADTKIKEQL